MTSAPTAAVTFPFLAPVLLVQLAVDEQLSQQGHEIQVHHCIVCTAVRIDPSWG